MRDRTWTIVIGFFAGGQIYELVTGAAHGWLSGAVAGGLVASTLLNLKASR